MHYKYFQRSRKSKQSFQLFLKNRILVSENYYNLIRDNVAKLLEISGHYLNYNIWSLGMGVITSSATRYILFNKKKFDRIYKSANESDKKDMDKIKAKSTLSEYNMRESYYLSLDNKGIYPALFAYGSLTEHRDFKHPNLKLNYISNTERRFENMLEYLNEHKVPIDIISGVEFSSLHGQEEFLRYTDKKSEYHIFPNILFVEHT